MDSKSKQGIRVHSAALDYNWQIRVRTASYLEGWIKDCFDELEISHEKNGSSLLTGELPDVSAVYGLILHLRDAGIELLSLSVDRIQA